jgi:hypothetical protein
VRHSAVGRSSSDDSSGGTGLVAGRDDDDGDDDDDEKDDEEADGGEKTVEEEADTAEAEVSSSPAVHCDTRSAAVAAPTLCSAATATMRSASVRLRPRLVRTRVKIFSAAACPPFIATAAAATDSNDALPFSFMSLPVV